MGNPIHICILTTAHPIDDVRVNHKFAQTFLSNGFRVSWVGPGHALFDHGNNGFDAIDFQLAPPIRGPIDRLLSAYRIHRIGKLVASAADVDVYYAPDPDSAPIALKLARRSGAKVLFDLHEAYHVALLDRWLLGLPLNFVRDYIRHRIGQICFRCDLVVGVSDAILTPYLGNCTEHMVIRSCAPSWFAQGPTADVCGNNRAALTIMHGKAELSRGTMGVMDAIGKAAHEIPRLRVTMLSPKGAANDAATHVIMSRALELGITECLDLRDGVSIQEMPGLLSDCDIGLIAYRRDLGIDSLPNRLFEYMAAGLAIIAPSYAVEIAKIIEGEKCGLLVDFHDPNEVAEAFVKLYRAPDLCRQMGQRARKAFLARHNWETEVEPVLDRVRSWFPGRR